MDISDDLISPFPTEETVSYYLTVNEFETKYEAIKTRTKSGASIISEIPGAFKFSIEVNLSSRLFVEDRRRYSFWDLLGDVGGFHDGLYIMCSLVMGSYSALAFKTDFINSSNVDIGDKDHDRSSRKDNKYRTQVKDTPAIQAIRKQQNCTVDPDTVQVFAWALK